MANNNITSANAVLILSVPLLLPIPTQIQGFETDDIFDTDDVVPTETRMGVDGFFVGGYVYTEKPMTITLSPASPSCAFFDSWQGGQQAALLAAPATGVITLTSIGVTYALTNGFLTRYKPIADAKKTLQRRAFRITWGNILGTPVGLAG
jgi:hypothetical protein